MDLIIGCIVMFLIFWLPSIIANWKFDHGLPPEGYKTDYAAMNCDFALGKSKSEVINKLNNGGYLIKK